jgi:hypothetical protein
MKRNAFIAAAILLAFLVYCFFSFGLPWYSIRQLKARYEQAQRGMTIEQVEALMGPPGVRRREHWFPAWDDNPLPPAESQRIASALRYSVPTFFLPVSFEFTFDGDDRLVGRHIYD